LQGGNRPHQGGFTRTIGTKQTKHAIGYDQVNTAQSLNPICVDMFKVFDSEHDKPPLWQYSRNLFHRFIGITN
jgi:hypothetical protein